MENIKQQIKTKRLFRNILNALPIISLFALFFLVPTQVAQAGWISSSFISAMDFVFGNLFKALALGLSKLASLITLLGGQFLDSAIRFSINGSNLQIGGVIDGWTIFRDLVNMLFIFILLYVAIMTILQASSMNAKKVLANLVIIGLLINFSFFLTGFVIDIGNALAGMLYDAATPGGSGIGGILIDRMDLSSLQQGAGSADSNFKDGLAYLLNALFFAIAGFVFFAGGFLFIVRYVSLLFILMLSPLAFAAVILPNTQKHWKKWLDTLIENTFVAPAYMLMIVITITIASAQGLLENAKVPNLDVGTGGQLASPILDEPGLLMNYMVIIGLMIGSITVAKAISGGLAGTATKLSGKVMGYGLGKTAVGANKVIGGRFAKMRSNTKLQDTATGKRGNKFTQFAARQAMAVADKGAKVNLNAAKPLASVLGAAGIQTNLNQNHGKGGYDQWKKDDAKKEMDRSKLYDNTTEIKEAREAKYTADEAIRTEEQKLNTHSEQHDKTEKTKEMEETRGAQTKLAEIKTMEKEIKDLKKGESDYEKTAEALHNDATTAKEEHRSVDALKIEKELENLNKNEVKRVENLEEKEKELAKIKPDEKEYQDLVNTNQHLIDSQNKLAEAIKTSDTKLGARDTRGNRQGGLTAEKKEAVSNMLAGKQHAREDYAQTVLDSGFGPDSKHTLMRTKQEQRDIWDDIRFDAGKSQGQRVSESIAKLLADSTSGDSTPPPVTPGGETP